MKTTMRQVAKRAGVSLATVSYVINQGPRPVGPERRDRVLAAMRELSYRAPAPRRNRLRPFVIGVVVPNATGAFFASAIQGIERVLDPAGHLLLTASSGDSSPRERQVVQAMLRRRMDGLILTPCSGVQPIIEQLPQRGVAVVIMDRDGGSTSLQRVTMNNYQSAFRAVRLLWESGHTRIAIVNGPDHVDTARERLRGYDDALAFAGLSRRSELVQSGPFTFDHGLQAARTLLGLAEPPSAIFSSSTDLTAGVLWGLRELRVRVPDDVAVVGFGDAVWASLVTPPLTVIEQPSVPLGEAAARLLLAVIGKEPSPTGQQVVLESRLILRESHWRAAQGEPPIPSLRPVPARGGQVAKQGLSTGIAGADR